MKPLIVANWKMNPSTKKEAEDLFKAIKNGVKSAKSAGVVICAPFIYIPLLKGLTLGAQNCCREEKGTFTGEISVSMLKSIGVEYVIIGHSERRKYFKETGEEINRKIKKAITAGLKVILCIGEDFEQREKKETELVLKSQIVAALEGIPASKLGKKLIITYEPLWAISTGDPYKTKELPTVDKVERIFYYIRSLLAKMYSLKATKNVRIIYGGSANAENAKRYLTEAKMQGLLVGGASLKAEEFIKIIKSAE